MATMQVTQTMLEHEFENVELDTSNPDPAYVPGRGYPKASQDAQSLNTAIQIDDHQEASDSDCNQFFCCIPFGKGKLEDDPKEPGCFTHTTSITHCVSDWVSSISKLTHGKLAALFSLVLALIQLMFYFKDDSYFQFQTLYGIAADNGFATPFTIFYLLWVAGLIVGPILIFAGIYFERPKLFLPHIYQTTSVLLISFSWIMYFVFSELELLLVGLAKNDMSDNVLSLGVTLLIGSVLLLGCVEYYLIVIRTILEAKDELKVQIKEYGRTRA